MMKYSMVSSPNKEAFEKQVNTLLEAGYVFKGEAIVILGHPSQVSCVASTPIVYNQAMVKHICA